MVREAEREDLKEILELYLYLHEDSIPVQSDCLSDPWKQILEDKNHHLIVNEVDRKIVSSFVCVMIPNLTRKVRPYAFVENVVTHTDFRRQGLTSECLEYAKQTAQRCNCYKIMLLTGSRKKRHWISIRTRDTTVQIRLHLSSGLIYQMEDNFHLIYPQMGITPTALKTAPQTPLPRSCRRSLQILY